jgi:hypothetical protein
MPRSLGRNRCSHPEAENVAHVKTSGIVQESDLPQWTVRSFRGPEDIVPIAELARAVYGSHAPLASPAYLEWKFMKNPVSPVIAVCDAGGKIVGCGALIPLFMKIDNLTRCCAIAGESMVHPSFRRQGIFVAVTGRSLEWARDVFSVVYGTKNVRSPTIRGVVKYLGFKLPGDIVVLRRYISTLTCLMNLWTYPTFTIRNLVNYLGSLMQLISISLSTRVSGLFARSMRSDADNDFEVSEIKPLVFGDEFDRLWEEVRQAFPIAVVRTKDFLNWRYSNPNATYVGYRVSKRGLLLGYCVFTYTIIGKLKIARVIDLLAVNSKTAKALVQRSVWRAKQDQVHILTIYKTKQIETIYRGLLLGRSWSTKPLTVRLNGSEIPEETVLNISNWYLTGMDIEDGI